MELSSLIEQLLTDALEMADRDGISLELACGLHWDKTLAALAELRRLPDDERLVLITMRDIQKRSKNTKISKGQIARELDTQDKGLSDTQLWRILKRLEGKRLCRRPNAKRWSAMVDAIAA